MFEYELSFIQKFFKYIYEKCMALKNYCCPHPKKNDDLYQDIEMGGGLSSSNTQPSSSHDYIIVEETV